ncbi:hypothetical protein BOX15_Mlig032589g1 [Macrostomum lignano]|uniref:Uncharacterized protein n=1 Tax=Macrostomum lignano TaxID=282301 RepID=A0A267FB33_9PLAT|nr:hypothetical protein BOX15_Mlig032589g1 [Macrostomum lignano]
MTRGRISLFNWSLIRHFIIVCFIFTIIEADSSGQKQNCSIKMAAVDFGRLGRDLPDLRGYRAALSRSSVAVSSEFNLPADRHLLASGGPHRPDQRQRFQRPFSVAQRDLDGDAANELGRLNLRPFSSAGTREVIAEAQRIVDKYRERTLAGRWPTDAPTRRSLQSARRVAPRTAPEAFEDDQFDEEFVVDSNVADAGSQRRSRWTLARSQSSRLQRPQQAQQTPPPPPPMRSPAALFSPSADPRRRSLATPLASQASRWHSRTEAEARGQAMRILRQVGLSDAYRSQAEMEEEAIVSVQPPPSRQLHPEQRQQNQEEAFASGPRPLRTPLASSGYASYEDFRAKTPAKWRHPLPDFVGAGYCDEATRQKVWEWLTEPMTVGQHDYLMKLCD